MSKRLIITLLIIILSSIIYAGQPDIDIQLDKTRYKPGEKLQGKITLTTNGKIHASTKLGITLEDQKNESLLTDLFNLLNIYYETEPKSLKESDPSELKRVSGQGYLGLKLPYYATIKSISLKIQGQNANSPIIDIGDDETEEWNYVGNFTSWEGDLISPSTLGDESEAITTEINDNGTSTTPAFCEIIELPPSKYFKVRALYKKVRDDDILKAKISSFDYFGNPKINGNIICELPKGTSSFGWNECEITSDKVISGEYLVCIYSTNATGETTYELKAESSGSSSGYKCPISTGSCIRPGPDYFIKIRKGNYETNLNSEITISENQTGFFIKAINDYLTSNECLLEDDQCIVPIRISSSSELTLSNLNLKYKDLSASTYTDTKLYDVDYESAKITWIEYTEIEGNKTSVNISFSNFQNITIPSISTDSKIIDLKVALSPGTSRIKNIIISKKEVQPSDLLSKITSNRNKIKEIKANNQDLIKVLGLNTIINKLNEYEGEYERISLLNISESQKNQKLNTLENTIDSYLKNTPKEITQTSIITDIQVIEPKDITSEITGEAPTEVYFLQNKIEVESEARVYQITLNSGESEDYTLIKKQIIPREEIKDAYIYEYIPKTIAKDTSKIFVAGDEFEVIEKDPVIRFYLPDLSSKKEITYSIKTGFNSGVLYNTKTIFIPKIDKKEQPETPEYECGDGVCTEFYEDTTLCPEDCIEEEKFPWIYIIIMAIVLILGLTYLYFYKGKYSIAELRKKKHPFKNEKDLNNLKNYINKSLNENIPKKDISKKLLKKGWTKKQILFAFEQIEYDKTVAFTLSIAPTEAMSDMSKLTDYIKRCRKLKIRDDKIVAALFSKGWKKEQVEEAFSKIK